jgi:hypothetical protein
MNMDSTSGSGFSFGFIECCFNRGWIDVCLLLFIGLLHVVEIKLQGAALTR